MLFSGNYVCALDPNTIMREADKIISDQAAILTCDLLAKKPGQEDKRFRLKVWAKGKEKTLAKFLAPAKERGTGYLKNKENVWYYLPNIEKSIKVSGRQSLSGTDFSNSDILGIDFLKDYTIRLMGEEKLNKTPCYLLDLKAKEGNITYDRIKCWVEKSNNMPLKFEYYTLSGELLKIMTLDQIKDLKGKIRPTRYTMDNRLLRGQQTIYDLVDIEYLENLSDNVFTIRYMEKASE